MSTAPDESAFHAAFRFAGSIGIGTGIFGLLYGAACNGAGLSLVATVLFSAAVFTGAAQFTVLPMTDVAWITVFLAALFVSLRLFLMSISLGGHLSHVPWWKQVLAVPIIIDGSWIAALAETRWRMKFAVFTIAGLWIWTNWVVGTALGHLAASLVPRSAVEALAFSGAIFLGMLLAMVARAVPATRAWHWLPSLAVSGAASLVMPLWVAFLLGLGTGIAAIVAGQATGGAGRHDG